MSDRIERFEELVAWRKARELTAKVYALTREDGFAQDFGLKDQARRSAVSIMSNIAEGFERGSLSEFHQFLLIAKASCAELRSQLYVALDAGYISAATFETIMQQAQEVARIIGGLRVSIDRKRDGR